MNTLTALKRYMKPGQYYYGSLHRNSGDNAGPMEKNFGVRELVEVSPSKFGFRTPNGRVSYCDWPKRSEIVFLRENPLAFQIHFEDMFLFYQEAPKP